CSQTEFGNKMLEQDARTRCWNKMLEQDAGTRCWNKMLEQDAGTRCWNKMLEQDARTRCWNKMQGSMRKRKGKLSRSALRPALDREQAKYLLLCHAQSCGRAVLFQYFVE